MKKYSGIVVPLITPVSEHLRADEEALARITERVVSEGCHPFVLGTTGEASSVHPEDRLKLVTSVVKQTAGCAIVYAGIASNCPDESIEYGKCYFDVGVDVVIAHPPHYYPLSPDDMFRYYNYLADKLPGPLMIYNIPVTTKISVPLDIVEKLSHHPNIVGLKDSEKDPDRQRTASTWWRERTDFSFFTGVGALCAEAIRWGADGAVPSSGNIEPRLYRELFDAARNGEEQQALSFQTCADALSQIYQKDRTISQSLAALKAIVATQRICSAKMLPPLAPVSDAELVQIQDELTLWRSEFGH